MLMNVNIDLTANKSNKLNESFVVQWAADVKYVLGHLLSPGLYPSLMEIEVPELTDSKLKLEKSIHNFEKSTGLIWPLR